VGVLGQVVTGAAGVPVAVEASRLETIGDQPGGAVLGTAAVELHEVEPTVEI
jgi:hypothetical protein